MPPKDRPPTDTPNDNMKPPPDPHGKAALLLVESLVHGLCEKTMLSAMDAVNITERAMSVQHDEASQSEHKDPAMWQSYALLAAISASLRADSGDYSFSPKLVP